MATVLLVHGGLYEDMTAERFWHQPGVTSGLEAKGWSVLAPDRPRAPRSWAEEAEFLASVVATAAPVPVVAGSNGVAAAVRLAIDYPLLVERLVLCWPATAGDERVDAQLRSVIADDAVADEMVPGETLRGVTDHEIASTTSPLDIIASLPENPYHQHRTVDAIARLRPDAVVSDVATPESPRPDFPAHKAAFVAAVHAALTRPVVAGR